MIRFLAFFVLLLCFSSVTAQKPSIQWLSFEQLEDALNAKPKKVLINFYADWCAYCKKMDQVAFKDTDVISKIKANYYAVKLNVETTDTIVFGGQTFTNQQVGKERSPVHDIALLLGSREEQPFSLPVILLLNENFEITQRYFNYLSAKKMSNALEGKFP